MIDVCNMQQIKELLAKYGFRFSKSKGQNFLNQRWVPERIVSESAIDSTCGVIEIGPGFGPLTQELCKKAGKVVALELDTTLKPVLAETVGEFDNLEIIFTDAMKADLPSLVAEKFSGLRPAACANLPYYITSPILMKLLECGLPFDYITVMIQKEVADRLCSPAGGKDYGAITAVLSYYGEAEKLFVVPADKFIPAPKVDSEVIRIRLYKERPYNPKNEALMFRTIKAAFAQRRKTLSNALSAGFSELTKEQINDIIASCGHEPTVRGERLGIAEFVALSDKIGELLA